MYTFPTKTTVGGIFERMHRYTPAILQFQNERSRNGTWLVVSQELSPADSLHFGWAHAFRSPGDPGQHNSTTMFMPDLTGGTPYGGRNENQGDMLTAAYKHRFMDNLLWYTNVAATFNGPTPITISVPVVDRSPPIVMMPLPHRAALTPTRAAGRVRRWWGFPPACNGSSNRFRRLLSTKPRPERRGFYLLIEKQMDAPIRPAWARSAYGRFCCRSDLKVLANSDSVF